jgi:hypothetical protein
VVPIINDVRRLGRSGGAARPVAPAKPLCPDLGIVLSSPEFASPSQDGFDPRGSSGRIQKAAASDGVRSPQ